MQIISAADSAMLIGDNWTLVPGGFGSCGHPDALTKALGERFRLANSPRNLTLIFAAGSGDRSGRGIDRFAQPGLVKKVIGGFWGLIPALGTMVRCNEIEAYNWPQGVVSQLFRATAAGLPGLISRVGLGTFIDPDNDGGRLNERTRERLIKKVAIGNDTYLFYPTVKIDCALLRGTASDVDGNISAENEVSFQDSLAQAMAAKNSGGIVIVQVEKIVPRHSIPPHSVRIPAMLVDYVVVAGSEDHPQTYTNVFDGTYTSAGQAQHAKQNLAIHDQIICRRAVQELKLHPGAVVNLGIGIPASIGAVANEMGYNDFTLTVESGQIGGVPASGLAFGASSHPSAVIEQSSLFDFYDGHGLDVACLGFAEIDSQGNVNVSKFSERLQGAGGFINITQSAKNLFFCGTFTTNGLSISTTDGVLTILQEGTVKKFVNEVLHLTFNGSLAEDRTRKILYITERAVFSLSNKTLRLEEIAPGIDIDKDIISMMSAAIVISPNCKQMDSSLFHNLCL